MVKHIKSLIGGLLLFGMVFYAQPVAAWDSTNDLSVMDTHKTIATQAFTLIRNDMPNDAQILQNLTILESNAEAYKRGSIIPDWGTVGKERDYAQYQDHFFNPYTGRNFTYEASWYTAPKIDDTAESQTRNYVAQAVAAWRSGDYNGAAYLLGKATHYFADLCEPHHAANLTAVNPTNDHSGYEKYVEGIKNNYLITSIGTDKSEYTVFSNENLSSFLNQQCLKYATISYQYNNKVRSNNTWAEWNEATDVCLKSAQKGTASVIYRFLSEVTYGSKPITAPIGKFHVVINIANENYAGTDDYVYFGMELSNGTRKEFNCDLAGDDFTVGSVGSYEFEITDPNFAPSQVTKVWVRKARYTVRDDWKPQRLQVFVQGTRVTDATINTWLGNTTYEIPLNGLNQV